MTLSVAETVKQTQSNGDANSIPTGEHILFITISRICRILDVIRTNLKKKLGVYFKDEYPLIIMFEAINIYIFIYI